MGISSNQARFLSLTARQVDLEQRVQQICQRRLRLSSELERVATDYNNKISNRKMFTYNTSNNGISQLSLANVRALKDSNGNNYAIGAYDGDNHLTNRSTGIVYTAGTNAFFVDCGGLPGTDANISRAQLGLPLTANESECVEAAIRLGLFKILKMPDEFTQSTLTVYNDNMPGNTIEEWEEVDWRTLPALADELYKGDDVDAENKYDRTITEINSQDKKLQLEQASVEVEYKAITSEKEAVKKILDQNASNSFKYFS